MIGPMAAPEAEIELSVGLVRSLLVEQQPELADLVIAEVASGWDNVVFRVGDDLAARMPRREIAAYLAANEQRWLAELAPRLPLPVPAPVFVGGPGPGYPWPWAIVPWFHGDEAARAEPSDWTETAEQLGAFLAALHQPAPVDAPPNPYRGVPLADRAGRFVEGLDALGDAVDRASIEARWAVLVATPEWSGPKVWLHGDLHPRNIVVHEGRLAAIVDFGDMTAGDPAVDLSVAWFWLPPSARETFRSAYGGVDADTWRRAKGWALCLSIAHLGGDDRVIPLGRHALAEVRADPD
jgi:aminoglycoside phosphotransferase (APT) family kinase protein